MQMTSTILKREKCAFRLQAFAECNNISGWLRPSRKTNGLSHIEWSTQWE